MSLIKPLVLALALGITSPILTHSARAEEAPAEKTAKEEKKEVKGPKMWGVWAKLASLTPEQKIKMKEIHEKALAEKRKIEDQEEADIMALLTDEQKLELQKNKEEEAAARKAKDAEKAAKKTADEKKAD